MPQVTKRLRTKSSKKGISWYINLVQKIAGHRVNIDHFNPLKDSIDVFIGGMFSYLYYPKYAKELPVWDSFPLVIPFSMAEGGFIGLNLHYLPIPERKKLLSFLMNLKAKKSSREYLKISYTFLKKAADTNLYKPCIHRYLFTQLRSRIIKIDITQWDMVASLPLQRFYGKRPY